MSFPITTAKQLNTTTQFIILFAGLVVIISGLRAASAIIVPFLLSLTVSLICAPMVLWLKTRKVPPGIAIALVITGVLICGALVGLVVGSSVNQFLEDLPNYQQRLKLMIDPLEQWLLTKGIDPKGSQIRENFDPSLLLSFAGTALTSLGNVMTNFFLIVLTAIFLLFESLVLPDKLKLARNDSSQAFEAINKIVQATNHYMAIKALLSLLTGVLITTWLWLVGVDYPLLWGMIALLLNFIPNFGSILAAIPAVLLALVQLGITPALVTAAAYVVVNTVVGNMLEPKIMGKGLDLSAFVVFMSLIIWGWIFGPVGMLLSVPLTILLKIIMEGFSETRWLAILLGSHQEAQDKKLPTFN